MQGRVAEHLVVGRDRYVSAYAADGIAHGGSVLYFQPLHGVAVITGPALRGIIQHTGIKSSAAAGAGFKQHFRKFPDQPFI